MTKYWRIAFWVLLLGWGLGVVLVMARVRGGFLTSYLSDLAFPPWCYILFRGLHRADKRPQPLVLVGDWFGVSPERTLIGIFLVGAITEIITLFWPTGIISGTFDPLDILAYGIGLVVCFVFDKRGGKNA